MKKISRISKYMLFATVFSILLISCSSDTETVEVIKEVEVVKEVAKSKGDLIIKNLD